MRISIFALSVAAFTGLCAAQEQYTIDPSSVSESDKKYWCQQNEAQCPLICLQQPDVTSMTTTENDCDPDTLTYNCVCENGVSPNITQYSQTLPFFICQAWGTNCVKGCNGDNTCADKCRADHPCGAQSPFKGNASLSSTASSTATATGSGSSKIPVTGFGGASSTSSADSGAPASASFMPGASLSMAVVFGSVFLGFAVLL